MSQEAVLLFLCGGRRVKLLARFREALAARAAVEGRLLTTDTERRAATSFFADATFLVPPCSETEPFAAAISAHQ